MEVGSAVQGWVLSMLFLIESNLSAPYSIECFSVAHYISCRRPCRPLRGAIVHQQLDVAASLIKAGARVNRQPGDDEAPPLLFALLKGSREIVELLLTHGASPTDTVDLETCCEMVPFDQWEDWPGDEGGAASLRAREPTQVLPPHLWWSSNRRAARAADVALCVV